jgi:histidinol-phosphate/aromatic aminotransferase/cobyric acid decarboxylase-like protein/choline kinase
MQAVILTAGRGRRMEPLSRSCHKALLEIGGSTILGRAMDSLLAAGVGPITIVTGYRSDDIIAFVADRYPDADVRFVHNERFDVTNNIVSLALALDNLDYSRDVILIECDLLFEPHVITELIAHPGKNVALVDQYRTGMDGTVVAIRNGYVSQVSPTTSQDADFSYRDMFKTLNIYRFDRVYCEKTLRPMLSAYANHVDANCYYELVLGMLANIPEHRISAQVVRESDWVEVDDPNDLAVATFSFEPDHRAALLDRSFGGHWSLDLLDFSLPRNAHFPTPAMHAALRHALPDVITGYGSAQPVLDEKLSYFLRCDPSRVLLLNGASQAYPILRQRFAGMRVARPEPSFGEYARCFPGAATYADAPGLDPEQIEAAARDADLLVAVNPNNPSGASVPTSFLYDLAARQPRTTFVVDESFLPFSELPSLVSMLEQAALPNVAVLTSLGKLLGVPGLRLGYLYCCDPALRADVAAQLPIWGVGALGEFFLELAVKFRTELDRSIEQTVAERDRMSRLLAEHPLVREVHPSAANFLLCTLAGDDPGTAGWLRAELLASDRIEIKDVSAKFTGSLPRIRLAVRTQQDNDRLLKAMAPLWRPTA